MADDEKPKDEKPAEKPEDKKEDAAQAAATDTGALASDTGKIADNTPAGDGKNMYVKVYAPFRVYYDGQANSISAVNDTGPFDILPRHHNFMTILNECEVVIRNERGEEKIPIPHGIMHVKADRVVVFLDL